MRTGRRNRFWLVGGDSPSSVPSAPSAPSASSTPRAAAYCSAETVYSWRSATDPSARGCQLRRTPSYWPPWRATYFSIAPWARSFSTAQAATTRSKSRRTKASSRKRSARSPA
ncbi:hypothetical protein [Halospeciosus flavus]|uniref:hypothetical protein n=1 Tax=Halospeciosus flavus TaxID=3032283 RepID=UPI00360C4C68